MLPPTFENNFAWPFVSKHGWHHLSSDNWDYLLSYRDKVIELVSRWVVRRSQRSMGKTDFFKQYLPRHPLA